MPLPGAIDPPGPGRSPHLATEAASSSSFLRKEKKKNHHPPARVSSEGPGAPLHAGYPLPAPMQPTAYVHSDPYMKSSALHVVPSTDIPYSPSTPSPALPTAAYPAVRGRAPKGKKKTNAFVPPHSPSYALPISPAHVIAAPLAGPYPAGSPQPLAVPHAVLTPHPSGMGHVAVAHLPSTLAAPPSAAVATPTAVTALAPTVATVAPSVATGATTATVVYVAAGSRSLLPLAVATDVPAPVDGIAGSYSHSHPHPHAHAQSLPPTHAHAYPYHPTAMPVAYVRMRGEPALAPVMGKNGVAGMASVASVPGVAIGNGNGTVMANGIVNSQTNANATVIASPHIHPSENSNSSGSMGSPSDGRRSNKKKSSSSSSATSSVASAVASNASTPSLPTTHLLPTTPFTATSAHNTDHAAPVPVLTPLPTTSPTVTVSTAASSTASGAGAVAGATTGVSTAAAAVVSSPVAPETTSPSTSATTAAAVTLTATSTATTTAAADSASAATTVTTNVSSSKAPSCLSISAPALTTPSLSSPEVSLSPPPPSTAPDSPEDSSTDSPHMPPLSCSSSTSTPYSATPPVEDTIQRPDASAGVKTDGNGPCHTKSEGRGTADVMDDVNCAAKSGANNADANAPETTTSTSISASDAVERPSTPLYRIPAGPTVMLTTALPRAYAHAVNTHISTDDTNLNSTSTAMALAAAAGVSLGVPGPGLDESVTWLWPRLGNANAKLATQHFANNAKAGGKFDHYETVAAEVKGQHDVQPLLSFDHMAMPPFLRTNIAAACYQVPTPIQKWSIPLALNNHDIMACAQTGSGKTVAFLFPLFIKYAAGAIVSVRSTKLHHKHNLSFGNSSRNGTFVNRNPNSANPTFAGYKPLDVDSESVDPDTGRFAPSALILSPTRELASQIYQECAKFSYRSPLRAVVVYGGKHQQNQILEMRKGVDILIATPGRLLDYLQQELITLRRVAYLVCDEADRMLDMGFEPQIRAIVSGYDMPVHASISIHHGVRPNAHAHVQHREDDSNLEVNAHQQGNDGNAASGSVISRQTLMFSATFPAAIQALASSFLAREYIYLAIGRVGATSDLIAQQFIWVPQADKMRELVRLCSVSVGRTVVFVERKTVCDEIEQFLNHNGCRVVACHGNKTQKQREEALRLFKNGKTHTLIATDVVARGLDIPDVQLVINFDMPGTTDSYVHRIGRTGRCGNVGKSIAFINEETQSNVVVDIVEMLLSSADARAEVHKAQEKGQSKGGMGTGAKVWCESTGGLVDESVLYGNPEDKEDGKIPAFMLALYERYTIGNRRNKGKYGASGGYGHNYGYNNNNSYHNTPINGYGHGRNSYNQHGRGGYQYNNGTNTHGGGFRRQNGYGYVGNGYPGPAVGAGMGAGANTATASNDAADAGTGYTASTPAQSYASSSTMYNVNTRTNVTGHDNNTGVAYAGNANSGSGNNGNMSYYPQTPQNTYGKSKASRAAPYTHPSQGYVHTPAQRGGQYDAHGHTHADAAAQAQVQPGHDRQGVVHGGAATYYPYPPAHGVPSTSTSGATSVSDSAAVGAGGAGATTTAGVDSASCDVGAAHHVDTANADPACSPQGMLSPSPVADAELDSVHSSDAEISESSDDDDHETMYVGLNGAAAGVGAGVSGYLDANGQFVPYTQSFPYTPIASAYTSYQYPQQQMQMQAQTPNGVVYAYPSQAYAPMHTAATYYPVSTPDQRGNTHTRTHVHQHYPSSATEGYNGRKQYSRRGNTHAGARTSAPTSFSTANNGYVGGMGNANASGGGYGAGAGLGDAAMSAAASYGSYAYLPQTPQQQQSQRSSGKGHQAHAHPTHYPQAQTPQQHYHPQHSQQQHGGSQRGAQHHASSSDGYAASDVAQPHVHAYGLGNHGTNQSGRNSGGGGGRGSSRTSRHGNAGTHYAFPSMQHYHAHTNNHGGNGGGAYVAYQQSPTQY